MLTPIRRFAAGALAVCLLLASPGLLAVVTTEAFDTLGGTPPCVAGWSCQNLSLPLGSSGWFQGTAATFPAQAGTADAYIAANYNDTAGAVGGTISNWLITPQVSFNPGATLSFYTRTTDGFFADRLEVRISTNGASANVGATANSVGDFTTLVFTVNPNLVVGAGTCPPLPAGGYPVAWCQITLTSADGIPVSGTGRIAFRYFVSDGGPLGNNSDYIGIDTFSYDDAAVGSTAPIFAYTPPAASTVPFTGGTLIGTTGSASIDVSIASAGGGSGAAATTTTTCTAPGAPFSGFGQSVSAVGAGAVTGSPLSGNCILGAAPVTRTLTCSEVRDVVPTAVAFTLSCPAGNATPPPALVDAKSRKVHGTAGTFDLLLQ